MSELVNEDLQKLRELAERYEINSYDGIKNLAEDIGFGAEDADSIAAIYSESYMAPDYNEEVTEAGDDEAEGVDATADMVLEVLDKLLEAAGCSTDESQSLTDKYLNMTSICKLVKEIKEL